MRYKIVRLCNGVVIAIEKNAGMNEVELNGPGHSSNAEVFRYAGTDFNNMLPHDCSCGRRPSAVIIFRDAKEFLPIYQVDQVEYRLEGVQYVDLYAGTPFVGHVASLADAVKKYRAEQDKLAA